MFEDSLFDEEIIYFKPGDKFYFLTDGLEFVFDNNQINKKYLKVASLTEFKNYVSGSLKNTLVGEEGLKDDCTLIGIEIK